MFDSSNNNLITFSPLYSLQKGHLQVHLPWTRTQEKQMAFWNLQVQKKYRLPHCKKVKMEIPEYKYSNTTSNPQKSHPEYESG